MTNLPAAAGLNRWPPPAPGGPLHPPLHSFVAVFMMNFD
eukprot:COSAG05_NODE_13711_length_420_cov_0.928349_1_plen_38_part_01